MNKEKNGLNVSMKSEKKSIKPFSVLLIKVGN